MNTSTPERAAGALDNLPEKVLAGDIIRKVLQVAEQPRGRTALNTIMAVVDAAAAGGRPHAVAGHGLFYVTRDGGTCVDLEHAATEINLCSLADVVFRPMPELDLDICLALLAFVTQHLTPLGASR